MSAGAVSKELGAMSLNGGKEVAAEGGLDQSWRNIKPADVLKFDRATDHFLCPLSANIYDVQFNAFKVRDWGSKEVLFEMNRPPGQSPPAYTLEDDAVRSIRYTFPADFLKLETVGTSLTFSVGPKEVPNFRMIERHYFKNKLIKSYDFTFGFCIPNSSNSWESVYPMPKLSSAEVAEMMKSPFETKSDSFYFVNDELFMHNKAEYAYK